MSDIRITDQYFAETPPFYFDKEAVADIIINRSFGESQTNSVIGYHVATHKEINKIARYLKIPYIHHALFFDMAPMSRFPIHVDKVLSMKCDRHSLNIPVKNTSMTVMNWWKHDKPSNEAYDEVRFIFSQKYKHEPNPSNVTTSPTQPFEECTLIKSCSMDKPHFVKVDDWHNVDNNHPTERSYFLALRFDDKLSEQDIRKLLKI